MSTASNITHLVHIGFDRREFPEFEARIIARIQQVCDDAAHIINFVDEAPYTPEDGEILQITHLAECLSKFVSLCDLKSTGMAKYLDFDKTFDEIPPEVLAFLKQELDGEWQQMQTPIAVYEQWISSINPGQYPSLPPDIKAAIDEHDEVKKSILGERFSEILEKMTAHFKGKNVFGLSVSDSVRNDAVGNPERKARILETTIGLVGQERVFFSGMRDGDMSRLDGAFNGEQRDKEFKDLLAKSGVDYPDWEQWFGGATDRILKLNRELTLTRGNRYYHAFMQSLADKGLVLDDTTKHILGGEYYGRCVHAYGNNLLLYRVPKKQIFVDSGISLIHSDDEGKFKL